VFITPHSTRVRIYDVLRYSFFGLRPVRAIAAMMSLSACCQPRRSPSNQSRLHLLLMHPSSTRSSNPPVSSGLLRSFLRLPLNHHWQLSPDGALHSLWRYSNSKYDGSVVLVLVSSGRHPFDAPIYFGVGPRNGQRELEMYRRHVSDFSNS
jgi:hypothetical protein